jgi:pSer/pThr/pTyr-binding forkhead associated (FHA) protein
MASGRFGSRAQVELRDQEASSEHALLICTNAAARIIDLDSSNGLFVNDERIEIAALSPGDIVRIGRTHLAFVPFPYMADD